MDELGSIVHLAIKNLTMKNEWEWHGEKEDEEGRAQETREKNNRSKEFFEENRASKVQRGQGPQETREKNKGSKEFFEENRASKIQRGQGPQETGREEARSGGGSSSSGY
ncbi:MAG: hypothetical protein V3T01_12530 [Myxococcota bacterium]